MLEIFTKNGAGPKKDVKISSFINIDISELPPDDPPSSDDEGEIPDDEIYNQYVNKTVSEIAKKYPKVKFKSRISDEREYRPIYTYPDGSKYEGQWLKGTDKRDGKGIQVWPDGVRYQGDWFNDQAHGSGQLIEPDSSHYDGEWKNDQQDGYGIEIMGNGNVYEGQIREGF